MNQRGVFGAALILAVVAMFLVDARPARADEVTDDVKQEPSVSTPRRPRWYGWQTYLVDAGSVLAIGAGLAMSDGTNGVSDGVGGSLVVGGLAGFFAVSPALHGMHDNSSRIGPSVALRLGGAGVGALTGYAIASAGCNDTSAHDPDDGQFHIHFGCDFHAMVGAASGIIVGAVAGSILDGALLARTSAPDTASFTVVPNVSVANRSFGLAVTGSL